MNYKQIKNIEPELIRQKIKEFLDEDSRDGDITSESIFDDEQINTCYVQAEEDGIFSGEMIIQNFVEDNFKLELNFKDGEKFSSGDILFKFSGTILHILKVERVLLNLLQRLCGIATLTNKYVQIANTKSVKILDTRKTMPGLREFDKYAVCCGGGTNHRLNLSEGAIIKDNHITAAGSIFNAVEAIRLRNSTIYIEVEAEREDQISEILESGADAIMLDNMSPELTQKCVQFIRNYHTNSNIFIESSGGINLTNIENYISLGIDAISIGALTHSAKNLNLHLEIE